MTDIERGYELYQKGLISYEEYRSDYAEPVDKLRAQVREERFLRRR